MARYRSVESGRFISKQNAEKMIKDFETYKDQLSRHIERHFATNATKFVSSLGKYNIPFDTGNLHDSIGLGLSIKGKMRKWTGAGGLDYLARPKLMTSYKMLQGGGESKKSRSYRMQHWGTFGGMIKSGEGTGKDYIEAIDIKLSKRVQEKGEGDIVFLCFAAIPYAYPLNAGEGKGAYYKDWFNDVTEKFYQQINQSLKYGFLSKDVFKYFRYLSKDGGGKRRVALNINMEPLLFSPVNQI